MKGNNFRNLRVIFRQFHSSSFLCAVPKRKVTVRRKRLRNSQKGIDPVLSFAICPNCSDPIPHHTICYKCAMEKLSTKKKEKTLVTPK